MPGIAIDINPNEWSFFEQMDFRKKVGVNPHYAVMKIGETFDSRDAAQFANIPPEYLLGIAWITARRDDASLTYEAMADRYNYTDMVDAVVEAAKAIAVERGLDPTPAPNRAARRTKTSTRSSTTSPKTKTSSAAASPSKAGSGATS